MESIIVPAICFLIGVFWTHFVMDKDVYKNGQVDALSGNIKYELVEHKDGTKTWEKIEEDETDN